MELSETVLFLMVMVPLANVKAALPLVLAVLCEIVLLVNRIFAEVRASNAAPNPAELAVNVLYSTLT